MALARCAVLLAACAASCALAAPVLILSPPGAPVPLRLASSELRRYLADMGVTPRASRAIELSPPSLAAALRVPRDTNAITIILATSSDDGASSAWASLPSPALVFPSVPAGAPGGFVLSSPRANVLAVTGSDAQHTLYGAYALLEALGATFTLAGATLPAATPDLAALAARLAVSPTDTQAPIFSTRGLQPFHDFASGPDWWSEDETKRVAENILSMKGNLLFFHTYPLTEPAVWVGLNTSIGADGNVTAAGAYPTAWHNTLRTQGNVWGYTPTNTSDLGYGAAQLFEHECFGHETVSGDAALCPLPTTPEDSAEVFNRVGLHWRAVFAHSHALGIRNVLSTEMPLSLPPPPPPPPGALLPLQVWYSATRNDHFITTTSCDECDGLYAFLGVTGWLYPPTPEGNVSGSTPVWTYYSGDKMDNMLSTSPTAPLPGYGQVRLEGFAPAPAVAAAAAGAGAAAATAPLLQYVDAATGHHWALDAAWVANATAAGFAPDPAGAALCAVFAAGPPVPSAPSAFDYYVGTLQRLVALLGDTLDIYGSWTPEAWEWNKVPVSSPLIQQAVNDTRMLQAAHDFVAPPFSLASCGWTVGPLGARWYYDTVLPPTWVISSIDMDVGNTDVDPAYANITHRPAALKWAIPWAEDDPGLTAPELWVNRTLAHAREASAYGVGGLLSIHWRTRMTSPQIGAAHAVAWNISLAAADYWGAFALGQFGDPAVAAGAAAIFASVDSFNLPRPVSWIGGPGGMSPSAAQCDTAAYAFVPAFVALRAPLLAGIAAGRATLASLERFDYWAGQFIYMASIAAYECSWASYSATIAAIAKIADPATRQAAARAQGVAARIALQANATAMVQNHLATASGIDGAGTAFNIISRGVYSGVGPAAIAALEALTGEPLPAAALAPGAWHAARPPQARVPVLRSMLAADEPLRIRALVLAAPAQAPRSVTLYSLPHGATGAWAATPLTQAAPAGGLARLVYTAALPPLGAGAGVDWYLEVVLPANTTAYTLGGLGLPAGTSITPDAVTLRVPPGGPDAPQSVITVPQ